MELEDIEIINNATLYTEVTERRSNYLIHEIIFSVICLIAICANSLMIYVIFRFSRMRNVPTILLANWMIADLLAVIYAPTSIALINYVPLSEGFLCIFARAGATPLFGSISFASAVLQDWFMAAYFEKASRTFRKYYKFVIVLTWAFILLNGSSIVTNCLTDLLWPMESTTLFMSFSAVLLIVIVLQFIRAVQKCRNKPLKYPTLMLTLTTGFVIMMFPGYLNMVVMIFTNTYHPWLGLIGGSTCFSSGILTFALMYHLNKDFRACLLRVLNRSTGAEEANC